VSAGTAVRESAGTAVRQPRGKILVSWMTSTDHKVIGYMYLITSFVFFLFGGVLALIMRAELARPGLQFVTAEQYNQLFTMHGTVMLLMFATPLFVGFGNVIMPLQIGSPDVAFPRLNLLSFYCSCSAAWSWWPASSPRAARRTSDGSPTRRSTTSSTRRVPAPTCGSWAWRCRGSARSSAASTSSPRCSPCARPA
jgi:hypothetical protein